MKTLFTIILALFFLFASKGYGQEPDEYTDGITKLVIWFSDIDKIITKISDKEKLKKIYRQLGYASEDIDNIALSKLLLAKELSKFSETNRYVELEKLKPEIDEIISDINDLLERLESIKANVAHTDQESVEKTIQTVREEFRGRKLYYLGDIKDFLYGKKTALGKIKNEATQAKKIADNASGKIKEAKLKIKEKLD